MAVVVVLVLGEHCCGMPLVDDQDAVEELAADGAPEPFGDRVGPRRPHRRLDDPDIDRGEHRVERGGELGVPIADEEPEAAAGVVEVHEQVAGVLGEPGAGGVGGDPEDVISCERAGGVHVVVGQHPDRLELGMVEQMGFVDDDDRGAAAFDLLDRERVDGLRDQGGVVVQRSSAERGDDLVVDAADPDGGVGQVTARSVRRSSWPGSSPVAPASAA
jgi:hypothetical protein